MRLQRPLLLALIAGWLVLPPSMSHAQSIPLSEIKDLRFGKHPDFVRIVIDSGQPVTFHHMKDHPKLAIGLSKISLTPRTHDVSKTYAPISKIELLAGEKNTGTLIVTSEVKLVPKFLALDQDDRGLFRLVIDLRPTDGNFEHLNITQEGINSKRVKVQFADPLSGRN